MFGRKRKREKVIFERASDVSKIASTLINKLNLSYINPERLFFVRSTGSQARAYARVWGLSRIFQEAAGMPATYIIEVISKYFDKLSSDEKAKVLIHELMHIPKTFSGALKPHSGKHHRINKREVEKLFDKINF